MTTIEMSSIAPNSENVIELTEAGIIGLETLCRLCANRTDHLIPIYEGEGAEHELEMKMNRYLPFKVEQSQSMPMHCCYQCASTVLQWHELVEVSLEANRRLRALQEDAIVHLTQKYPKADEHPVGLEIVSDSASKCSTSHKSNETELNDNFSACRDNMYTVTLTEDLFKQEIKDDDDIDRISTGEIYYYYSDENLLFLPEKTEPNESTNYSESVDHDRQPIVGAEISEPYEDIKEQIFKKECTDDLVDISKNVKQKHSVKKHCFICQRVFKSNRTLTKHMLMTHGKVRILQNNAIEDLSTVCDICHNEFVEKSELIEHYKSEHSITLTVLNDLNTDFQCYNSWLDTVPLESNHDSNDSPKKYYCDICGNDFTRKYDVKRHRKSIHPDYSSDYHESIFIRPVVKSENISDTEEVITSPKRRRRRTKKSIEIRRYYCDRCPKSFTRANDVRRHMFKSHGIGPPGGRKAGAADTFEKRALLERCKIEYDGRTCYKCEICNKIHRLPYLFLIHWRVHTGERPYCCHICAKTFRDSSGLNTHIKVFHYRIKNHQCTECGRRFSSKAARDKHAELHLDVRPFICDICGKAFKQKVSLYVHKKFHSDKKPFTCLVCGKQYRRNFELTMHGWLHTGYKPHACPTCEKRFRLKQDLNRHMKIHNKYTGVECEICGSTFTQPRYLKNHMRRHENKTDRNKSE